MAANGGVAAALVAACLAIPAATSRAASDDEIKLIYETVKAKYSSFSEYCNLPEDDRRRLTVKTTLDLATQRKLADPVGAGPKAGEMLRKECGIISPLVTPQQFRWMALAKPLEFDSERHALGLLTSPASLANRVYAPTGAGPFPAVVISPTRGDHLSEHLLVHTKSLISAGFAVMVVDTFGPRGYRLGVSEPAPAEGAKDAYDALAYLVKLPFIDASRIYQTGYSYGGNTTALLASPQGSVAFKAVGRFKATVANYGACNVSSFYSHKDGATKIDLLSADSDRPLLMLMAELDIENPPSTCFPLLEEMRATGKPVEWHIYPKTTHAWDKREHNGYVYRTTSGDSMRYRYDPDVTQDATDRMIAFFNKHR